MGDAAALRGVLGGALWRSWELSRVLIVGRPSSFLWQEKPTWAPLINSLEGRWWPTELKGKLGRKRAEAEILSG